MWITVTGISDMLDISYESAHSIIHKDLGYQKIHARQMPSSL